MKTLPLIIVTLKPMSLAEIFEREKKETP